MIDKQRNRDFLKVLAFLKKRVFTYLCSLLINNFVVSVCYNIVLAIVLKDVLNAVQFHNIILLWRAIGIAGISFLVAFISEPVSGRIKNRCVRETMLDIRQRVFSHFEEVTIPAYEAESHGDLITKLNKDVDILESIYLSYLPDFSFAVIHGGAAIIIMLSYNLYLAALSIVLGLISVSVNFLISKGIRNYSKQRQNLYGKLTQELMDLSEGFIEIKMTNSEYHFEEKFKETSLKLNRCEMKNEHLKVLLSSSNNMFSNINNIGIMAVGLYLVLKGSTSIGIVVSIIMLQGNASFLFQNFSEFLSGLSNAFPSARRIFEILELETEKDTIGINETATQKRTGEVILEQLSFGYRKENDLLKNLNITVKKGQYIGILGESGAGKSTLVKILLGFYTPVEGNYYLNGINVKNLSRKQVRSQIAYLDQESHLFHLTIENNVRLGNHKASMEEVIEACKKAGAHEFIMKLPDRYQTVINKSGDNISGGQKQRIALARMFISDRPILLIDEGTSNLDKVSEQIVFDAVLSMKGKKTIIMVTHKADALKDSDCVYTLKKNQICINNGSDE